MLDLRIQKRLRDFHLEVSLSLGSELVAIFGPSGSGKSLTLQCISGLLRPDSGRIVLDGRTLFDSDQGIDLRPQARRVGYVFQDYALFPHLSVADNVAYGLHSLPKQERLARVKQMIATMRLEGLERRRPSELSGGQQQRVALARVLVTRPDLLLLDEPFAALDSPIRGRLHAELLQLLRGIPITTILVTHDLAEAYTLSRQMVVYDAGRVLQAGPREEILSRPASRTVARFTGTKNLFRATVTRLLPPYLEVRVGDLTLRTPCGPYHEGDRLDLCLRPEAIEVLRPEEGGERPDDQNRFDGDVVAEIAHGTSFTLLFKLAGDPLHSGRDYDLHIEIPANLYHDLGLGSRKRIAVSLKPASVHLIGPTAER